MHKDVLKRRKHRKFVRKQKQLLRRRHKKHRPRKWFLVQLTGLEFSVVEHLRDVARRRKCSVETVIRDTLKRYMDMEMKNGTQSQLRQSNSEGEGSQS